MAAPPRGCLDTPADGARIYDQAISLAGWVYAPERDPASCLVRAYLDDHCIAETSALLYRPDVCQHLGLTGKVPTGFRMLGRVSPAATAVRKATLSIFASWAKEPPECVVRHQVWLLPALLSQQAHGSVVHPANEAVLHREHIYGSGPPTEMPAGEVADLIQACLPERTSVLDVGCGAGAYGPGLIAAGHDWLGLETDAGCFEILRRRQLPFRRVELESVELPCTDGEWECAICIEVLEHVPEPEAFLNEIARAVRRRALFSVPNMEVLPYMHPLGIVPWHLLEADHKNFFTRASLRSLLEKHFRRVEVFSYGEHPVKTREGLALHLHLFAIAEK